MKKTLLTVLLASSVSLTGCISTAMTAEEDKQFINVCGHAVKKNERYAKVGMTKECLDLMYPHMAGLAQGTYTSTTTVSADARVTLRHYNDFWNTAPRLVVMTNGVVTSITQ